MLSNPINDARLIAKTLQNDLGFDDVKIIENADMRSLNRAVDEFVRVVFVDLNLHLAGWD